MKIGLKLYPQNLDLVEKYNDLFDFFEVLIEPDFDVNNLKHYDKEITIHAAHGTFGLDLADSKKEELNKEILEKARKAADIVDSKFIIVHPGHKKNENSERNMLNFLKNNFDKRFIFENCLISEDRRSLFSTPEEMKKLLEQFNIGMCLDFEHAIISANFLKKDPLKFIKSFLELNVKCFHVSGVSMDTIKGMHNHLFEVDNNYEFLKWIPKNKYITFETRYHITKNKDFVLKDIEFLKQIIK